MKRPRLLNPGERPTHDEWNELVQQVYALSRMTVSTPLKFTNSGGICAMSVKITSGLPLGNGQYKVLQLVDTLNPGTPNWDNVRFHQ